MKLLIVTQKVDINDDLLGFMHGWIEGFAKHCKSVIVIALGIGEHSLPRNVKILSLGKERLQSSCAVQTFLSRSRFRIANIGIKLSYCWRFYKYIWQERKNYDYVLVHMNKEYMLLGGMLWRSQGKKAGLWYNHSKGNIFSQLAGVLANKIFYTSSFSFFAKHRNAEIMPAGIDTNVFKKSDDVKKIKNSILFLGRISPVKNIDILIKAMVRLDKEGIDFILNIVGEPGEKDKEYFKEIESMVGQLKEKGKISFLGKVANYETPRAYNKNEIFINLTGSGSFDKTILEAMACETAVLISNRSFNDIFPKEWHELMILKEKNDKDLTNKIIQLIQLDKNTKENIEKKSREIILKYHSLDKLINRIIKGLE